MQGPLVCLNYRINCCKHSMWAARDGHCEVVMYRFLLANRDDLIERCKAKVALRPRRAATEDQLAHGVPMFIDQLTRTLAAENKDDAQLSIDISGPSGGQLSELSEIGIEAIKHGEELLNLGYSVDQVVHDYGDLCQSLTELAFECDEPFTVMDFKTLNRCLDNAIAEAVTAFALHHDARIAHERRLEEKLRLGFLTHELRNLVGTAASAVRALELGSMPMGGATGAVLKRSLASLASLIDRSIQQVTGSGEAHRQTFSVSSFIADAELAARLDARLAHCQLEVRPVDPALKIHANRNLLQAAVANLLQNAFKYTQPNTVVTLMAFAAAHRVLIKVADHCGGLHPGDAAKMFVPFHEDGKHKAGLGLGLSIARQSVEADFGTLRVHNIVSTGCVFTIDLPLHTD